MNTGRLLQITACAVIAVAGLYLVYLRGKEALPENEQHVGLEEQGQDKPLQETGPADAVAEEQTAPDEPMANIQPGKRKFQVPAGPKYLLKQLKAALEDLRDPPGLAPASDSAADIADYLVRSGISREAAQPYVNRIRAAATQGDPEALRSLGELIERGLALATEPAESFNLFLSAANAGDAQAARYVGHHYEQGLGVAADPQAALEWYGKAIELGHVDGWVDISNMYISTALGKPDFKTAGECLDTAIMLGSSEAKIAQATNMLSMQSGDQVDMEAVLSLLDSAAEAGNSRAHSILGALHAKDDWGIKDRDKAFAHMVVAANLGEDSALYSRGSAGLKSSNENFYNQALEDLATLTARGSTSAANKLVDHLLQTQSTEWTDEALELLEWSGEMGDQRALVKLINWAENGQQVGNEVPNADYWLDKLSKQDKYSGYLIADLRGQGVPLAEAVNRITEMSPEDRYIVFQRVKSLNDPIELTTGDYAPPRAIRAVTPEYPKVLAIQKISGTAVVRFVVRKDGSTSNFVVESCSHPAFAKAAIEAIEQWQFEPAYKADNTKANVRTRIEIPFRVMP